MTHTKESIQALLDSRDAAVYRAVRAIQARQTADEQAGGMTKHTNGVGWSKHDAEWMADMLKKMDRYGSLLPKPLAITRNKVKRYWRQLLEIANATTQPEVAAVPVHVPAATMPTVSPDREDSDTYDRYSGRRCGCEENDGEVLFEDCDRCQGAEFGRFEAARERAIALAEAGTW
jgi:hypothetical protein